jgi:transposase
VFWLRVYPASHQLKHQHHTRTKSPPPPEVTTTTRSHWHLGSRQPISPHQGKEIWKAAHELRNHNVGYGIWANDKMVCSETARWVLVRAGRRVPETQSKNRKIVGIDIGLNKKTFVDFSPSDFYENEQYFVIHGLGLQRKDKPVSNKNQQQRDYQ